MATLYSDRRLSDDERRRRGDTCCNGTQHCIAIVTDLAAVVRWSFGAAVNRGLAHARASRGPNPALLSGCPAPVTRVEALMIFFNSTQGLVASTGVDQFAATGHAMRALADSTRAEVNSHGVRAHPHARAIHPSERRCQRDRKLGNAAAHFRRDGNQDAAKFSGGARNLGRSRLVSAKAWRLN